MDRLHANTEETALVRRPRPPATETQVVVSRALTGQQVDQMDDRGPAALGPAHLLALQTTAGNHAVGRLLHTRQAPGGGGMGTITIQRMKEPVVTHPKLLNLVIDLYKGAHMKRGRMIGDGSTADAIRAEHRSGNATRGVHHDEKGRQYIQALNNWLNRAGPDGGVDASAEDRKACQDLIDDLTDALKS